MPTDLPLTLSQDASQISPGAQVAIYCAVVGLASLLGGGIAASLHLGHRKLQIALSFVAGTMLGVGVLHLLPHAVIIALEGDSHSGAAMSHGALHSSLDGVMLSAVLGFLAMFLLERFFHFHQHESPEQAGHHDCCDDGCSGHDHADGQAKGAKRGHSHGHGHSHGKRGQVSELGWVGASIGLSLHSLLEGVALAAAVLAGQSHGAGGAIAGLSTFLVILLHKPFDGLTVATLVRASGRPKAFAHAINALFALVVPVGAAALWFGVEENGAMVLPYALAFSAGTFLCIATSDLLPELQFHRHDRLALSASLVIGLAIAGGIARVESAVAQSHDHSHSHDGHDHGSGDDHDHDHSHDGHDHAH
ncbi:MAG: ZIP family metal transporter [Phycisphaerales bacterium]